VIGADLGDLPVAHLKPLGATVQPPLARLRVPPGHRPLDHGLVPVGKAVLVPPLPADVVDRPARVLGDLPATVRAEARVVVGGILGEVPGDQVDVGGVERLVVTADVGERVDLGVLRSSLG
jgi:hypothetical protein